MTFSEKRVAIEVLLDSGTVEEAERLADLMLAAVGPHPMTDPVTHAFELLDELLAYDFTDPLGHPLANAQPLAALRLAITQIPTTSWQPIQTAPIGENIRVLYDLGPNSGREVIDARLETKGRWWSASGEHIDEPERLLAWRPADSTELPEDWGTE